MPKGAQQLAADRVKPRNVVWANVCWERVLEGSDGGPAKSFVCTLRTDSS